MTTASITATTTTTGDGDGCEGGVHFAATSGGGLFGGRLGGGGIEFPLSRESSLDCIPMTFNRRSVFL